MYYRGSLALYCAYRSSMKDSWPDYSSALKRDNSLYILFFMPIIQLFIFLIVICLAWFNFEKFNNVFVLIILPSIWFCVFIHVIITSNVPFLQISEKFVLKVPSYLFKNQRAYFNFFELCLFALESIASTTDFTNESVKTSS